MSVVPKREPNPATEYYSLEAGRSGEQDLSQDLLVTLHKTRKFELPRFE